MSDIHNREHYEGTEGTTLIVKIDENTTVELTQVDYNDTSNAQIDGFSVLFEGSDDAIFDQGLYSVEHADVGAGEVFLVPVLSQDPEKRKYELVVSKLKKDVNEAGGDAGQG
ncbi:hypothetical protein BSZ35_05120 [Salinibacter sp. 10B]|uniref:DUF6916 family protein n=1 Tax=Salinibacter sp. 10B TaxID=1923971 RepID=UPI000CF4B8FF|nr:hypothetical protein [Salinibacter sp. 10B]PQJ34072.1 hypothetical protein BSZ35_05120 [Salinibacter sp. 10B]